MTPDEQDRLISAMLKERNALRREGTLLDEQIGQTLNGMRRASGAAALLRRGDATALDKGLTYQAADEFLATMKRRHAVKHRLAELDDRLDTCC